MNKIKSLALIGISFLLPQMTNAANSWAMPTHGAGGVQGVPESFDTTLITITNYILGFVASIAVLALIWGGVQYLTSAGNQDTVKSGKDTIKNGMIGLVIAGLAYAIVNVIVTVILV